MQAVTVGHLAAAPRLLPHLTAAYRTSQRWVLAGAWVSTPVGGQAPTHPGTTPRAAPSRTGTRSSVMIAFSGGAEETRPRGGHVHLIPRPTSPLYGSLGGAAARYLIRHAHTPEATVNWPPRVRSGILAEACSRNDLRVQPEATNE